ncbi:MAG: TRAP transporter small permease [Flavobacteriaceae bacterium]|jgi:TRAP-type C4-dicarboxylate transport system permease small subunit|nr:TRAP transporter small permease [Flavobacteriaceae bacterium]MDG1912833.1 TRAP transporter small permease [Flavobacteriaceae bacterium]
MKKIRTQVDRFVGKLLVLILGIMVINVLWQVFSRYFTDNPSSFTDELARYLMMWLGILGAAYVGGRNEHVAIDFFAKKTSPKIQKWLKGLISLSIITFASLGFVIGGGRLVYITMKLQQYSPSLQIPLALVYAVVPISGLLLIFYKITPNSE